ncbi:MAG: galactose oxidase, partial [Bacteroidales bacterium]|nr:galactose oxidase [Bacteroidales bacterium]
MKGKTILIASYAFLILGLAGCKHSEEVEYGDWIKRSDFEGVARSDAASFSINDKGYVFGGYDGKNRLSDLWEY